MKYQLNAIQHFDHKKIGIWGFGVVGKSALHFFDQLHPTAIEILDQKAISLPVCKNQVFYTQQTPESIQKFLHNNDIILISPGIALHAYQQFAHKFISELDLYQKYAAWRTIAITGSLGKTSTTHLLTSILQQMHLRAVAAGNIGNAMLNVITEQNISSHKPLDIVVLELSSFQLQQAKIFAPDLAIITNLYENHLDHHKDMAEYCAAKCNIFAQQNNLQQALLPLDLVPLITQHHAVKNNAVLFSTTIPTAEQMQQYQPHAIYYLDADRIIYRMQHLEITKIFDLQMLPTITFDANWLVIIAALHLQNIALDHLASIAQQLQIPDHRLQKIRTVRDCNFYNDSKSTVWQATLQAVLALEQTTQHPIKLFVGGLSKGADRTPLFVALAEKNITVFAFGKESEQIAQLCTTYQIAHHAHSTLDAAWQAYIDDLHAPAEILFSPGGSSYDLFENYQARGAYFYNLVQKIQED